MFHFCSKSILKNTLSKIKVGIKRWWAVPDVSKQEKEDIKILSSSTSQEKAQQGHFYGLIQEMKLYHCRFCTYFRMSVAQFEFLLAELGPHLRRQRNYFRVLINLKRRLAACWCQNRIILLFILLVISLYIQYLGVVLAMSTPDWSDWSVLFIHMWKS